MVGGAEPISILCFGASCPTNREPGLATCFVESNVDANNSSGADDITQIHPPISRHIFINGTNIRISENETPIPTISVLDKVDERRQ
jgi:hypothetical protein